MMQFSVAKERCTLCISKSQSIKVNYAVYTRSLAWAIGCWNKDGWMQRNACPQPYCTAVWHNPRNNHMAAVAFALISFYARGNSSFPRFSKRFHSAPFLCACDERVGWRVECSPARAHGSWKGFLVVTCSLSAPINGTEAPLDLWIIQTVTAGGNASTTLHNFTICQVAVLPLKKQGGNKFLVKLL